MCGESHLVVSCRSCSEKAASMHSTSTNLPQRGSLKVSGKREVSIRATTASCACAVSMMFMPYTAMLRDETLTEKRGHLLVCDQMLLTLVCLNDPCHGVTQVSVDSFSLLSSFRTLSQRRSNCGTTCTQGCYIHLNSQPTKRLKSEHVFASAFLARASCEQILI